MKKTNGNRLTMGKKKHHPWRGDKKGRADLFQEKDPEPGYTCSGKRRSVCE